MPVQICKKYQVFQAELFEFQLYFFIFKTLPRHTSINICYLMITNTELCGHTKMMENSDDKLDKPLIYNIKHVCKRRRVKFELIRGKII